MWLPWFLCFNKYCNYWTNIDLGFRTETSFCTLASTEIVLFYQYGICVFFLLSFFLLLCISLFSKWGFFFILYHFLAFSFVWAGISTSSYHVKCLTWCSFLGNQMPILLFLLPKCDLFGDHVKNLTRITRQNLFNLFSRWAGCLSMNWHKYHFNIILTC